jgi:outer membrane protein OmpA-like peptidoglycan-associated protein
MGSLLLSACARKKYVREQVATLEPKITAVSNAVKENAERIDAVNVRATQGITAAAAADTKATAAGAAAAAADTKAAQGVTAAAAADTKATAAGTSAATANTAVATANTRIGTVDAKVNTVDTYTQSGQIVSVMFDNDKDTLTDDAKKALDGVAGQVSGLKSGYMLELQGFTDSRC